MGKLSTFGAIREAIVTICLIECDKCKKIEKNYHYDEYYFAKELEAMGWTHKNDKVLCHICSHTKKK